MRRNVSAAPIAIVRVPDALERLTSAKSCAAFRSRTRDVPDDAIVHVPASASFEIDADPVRTTGAADARGARTTTATPETNADKRQRNEKNTGQ